MKKVLLIVLVLSLVSFSLFAQGAAEETYPTKNINLTVPYGAGGQQTLQQELLLTQWVKSLVLQLTL